MPYFHPTVTFKCHHLVHSYRPFQPAAQRKTHSSSAGNKDAERHVDAGYKASRTIVPFNFEPVVKGCLTKNPRKNNVLGSPSRCKSHLCAPVAAIRADVFASDFCVTKIVCPSDAENLTISHPDFSLLLSFPAI